MKTINDDAVKNYLTTPKITNIEATNKVMKTYNDNQTVVENTEVFDYYDTDIFKEYADYIKEEENYNPTWEIVFDYIENIDELEKKIIKILDVHKNELKDVYETIKDKEDEYNEEK